MKTELIQYKFHFFIIGSILILQFFFCDIFAFFYLQGVENTLKKEELLLKGKFYQSGKYDSLFKDPRSDTPNEYKFVFVKNNNNLIKEIYYTKYGEKITVIYMGNKWEETSGFALPNLVSFLFPVIGFMIFLFSIFHKIIRTGEIISWKLRKLPYDKTEKICLLYGLTTFFGGFFFPAIRQLWLKLPM